MVLVKYGNGWKTGVKKKSRRRFYDYSESKKKQKKVETIYQIVVCSLLSVFNPTTETDN
jgi:hypothetical protein